jgi:hypothetical protein
MVSRNVASARLMPRYKKWRSEKFLDAQAYAAVGCVPRDLEVQAAQGGKPSLLRRALLALRVPILQRRAPPLGAVVDPLGVMPLGRRGAPHWDSPGQGGDRGGKTGGRWIFLGPDAVRCLREMPRPVGSEQLTVPGKIAGQHLHQHGPDLARAAALVEAHFRRLLGNSPAANPSEWNAAAREYSPDGGGEGPEASDGPDRLRGGESAAPLTSGE